LALIDVLMIWRDTRRACGKPGCPNDIPSLAAAQGVNRAQEQAFGSAPHLFFY
jgi:hypothetical protein